MGAEPEKPAKAEELALTLTVNGVACDAFVPPQRTLLHLLRDDFALTGTKECCSVGECGACTVLMDDRAVNACLVLAVEADGHEVTTIEGLGGGRLAEEGGLTPLQEAFLEQGAVQCGFCIPGMVMAGHALLRANPRPTPEDVREGLAGNLCRCGGYTRIVSAVLAAADAAGAAK